MFYVGLRLRLFCSFGLVLCARFGTLLVRITCCFGGIDLRFWVWWGVDRLLFGLGLRMRYYLGVVWGELLWV